jgi:hypothetical protein
MVTTHSPLPSLSHQPTMPPNSSRSNGSSSDQLFCRLMRNRSGVGCSRQPASGRFRFPRASFNRRRQMPQRRRGDQLRGSGMLRWWLRGARMVSSPGSPGRARGDLFRGQQLVARFAIQHIIRLTTAPSLPAAES